MLYTLKTLINVIKIEAVCRAMLSRNYFKSILRTIRKLKAEKISSYKLLVQNVVKLTKFIVNLIFGLSK